jgi:hypothetical protein
MAGGWQTGKAGSGWWHYYTGCHMLKDWCMYMYLTLVNTATGPRDPRGLNAACSNTLLLLLCQLSMLLNEELRIRPICVVGQEGQCWSCCTYLAQGSLHVVQDPGCITATQSRPGPGNGIIDGSNGLRGEVGGLASCCWGWGRGESWGGSWGDWGGCSLGCCYCR